MCSMKVFWPIWPSTRARLRPRGITLISRSGEFTKKSRPMSRALRQTTVTASAGKATGAAAKKAPIKKAQLNPAEERGSALQKIAKLDIKGRIQLAMKGSKEERSLLIRDGTKIVALAVLESPKDQ